MTLCIPAVTQDSREGEDMPTKSEYEWRKEHNLCVRCGNETPIKGKAFCWRCLMAKRDDRGIEYVRRVDGGLCASCGKPLDREGVICESCRLKRKEKNAARRARFLEAGLCPRCGKRPMFDGQLCGLCRAKKQRLENARYKRRVAA